MDIVTEYEGFKNMLKKGFTLAEVLLTLTIIGVIAAITMPALMTNVNDNILEAQVRKFYSSLTDGLDMYKAQNDQDTLIPGFRLNEFRDRIMHTENCDGGECFAATYTNYNRGALEGFAVPNENVRRLRDGSVFAISQPNVNQNRWQVIADVNGRRGPNRMGEDLWRMFIDANGRIEINHIHPAECKEGLDQRGSCIGIFASNGMRFRNYRDYVENGDDVAEGNNGGGRDDMVTPLRPFDGGNVRRNLETQAVKNINATKLKSLTNR